VDYARSKGLGSSGSLADVDAAIAIVHGDCFGDLDRARKVVDHILEAAGGRLQGRTLFDRVVAFLAWNESGEPKQPRALSSRKRRYHQETVSLLAAATINQAAKSRGRR
jgi:hypothetical protein